MLIISLLNPYFVASNYNKKLNLFDTWLEMVYFTPDTPDIYFVLFEIVFLAFPYY